MCIIQINARKRINFPLFDLPLKFLRLQFKGFDYSHWMTAIFASERSEVRWMCITVLISKDLCFAKIWLSWLVWQGTRPCCEVSGVCTTTIGHVTLLSAWMMGCSMPCRPVAVLITTAGEQCVLDNLLVPRAGLIAATAEVINCQVKCLKVWLRGQTFMLNSTD